MTKINKGILGGISGSIGGIMGYQRNGKAIIQRASKSKGDSINSVLESRKGLYKQTAEHIFTSPFNPTNAIFLPSNALVTVHEILFFQFIAKFPNFDNFNEQRGNLFNYSNALQINIKYEINPASDIIFISWRNVAKDIGLKFKARFAYIIYNLTDNTFNIDTGGNRNDNTGFNLLVPRSNPQKLYFIQFTLYNNSPEELARSYGIFTER